MRLRNLNSVDAFYYHGKKWSSFPCMLSTRSNHTAVSISSKIVYGGISNSCEVFGSVSRKFTSINILTDWVKYLNQS